MDASRSIRQAEVGAMRKMTDRTAERFGLKPDWVAADTAYGSSDNLVCDLPPALLHKSERERIFPFPR